MLLQSPGIYPLELDRKGTVFPLQFALIERTDPGYLEQDAPHWLNPDEQVLLEDLHSPKKRRSFLLGRFAAKLALTRYLGTEDMLSGSIVRGALGQPVVQADRWAVPEVSLAHSGNSGCCICFPPGQQFGLDIEELRPSPSRVAAVESRLTPREKALIQDLKGDHDILIYQCWTMKEALSKVLRCGLTLPFAALEVKELQYRDHCLHGQFTHFTQYRGFSEQNGNLALSLVFPWKSRIRMGNGPWL